MKRLLLAPSLVLTLFVFFGAVSAVNAQSSQPKGSSAGVRVAVDLNTASQAELEALPGVGPATAKKIIAGRPYTSVDDLSKANVPPATIEKIRPMVKVGPAGTAAAGAAKGANKGAKGVEKGAGAAASGVEKGAGAAASGAEKGAGAAASGVQKGAGAVEKGAGKVRDKVTGETSAQQPPAPGMVWVNTETKVFHKEGDRWYGKTKHGKWMTEDDAVKAGYRPAKEGAAKK